LEAEVYGKDAPVFPKELDAYRQFRENQMALFQKRRQLTNEDVGTLEKLREISQEELDMNLPLLKTGDVSRAEILKLQRQVADLSGQIQSKRNKFMQDIQTDLSKAQEELSGVVQVMAQRKEELDLTEIRAPMDGVVRNVRLTTLGGVARPGDELMQLVPVEDGFVIEAKVRTADVGFLRLNLPTTVKLDAYDYSVYGTLLGHVSYISADTLTEQMGGQEVPYYRVHVKIDRSDLRPRPGEKLDIQPGMTSMVEIKTGSKTVWDYLTKPITKTLGESLRER
jgi:membrane fusion protein, adhesin transport system